MCVCGREKKRGGGEMVPIQCECNGRDKIMIPQIYIGADSQLNGTTNKKRISWADVHLHEMSPHFIILSFWNVKPSTIYILCPFLFAT
jgi:hypothetical protein